MAKKTAAERRAADEQAALEKAFVEGKLPEEDRRESHPLEVLDALASEVVEVPQIGTPTPVVPMGPETVKARVKELEARATSAELAPHEVIEMAELKPTTDN